MNKIVGFSCIRCGAIYPVQFKIDSKGCPQCLDEAPANLRPIYDPGLAFTRGFTGGAPRSLWAYAHMLPSSAGHAVSLGEGHTPLIEAFRLGQKLGVRGLFVKDEGRNPTWSHKDRFSTLAVSIARERNVKVVATASSGNAGASLAAYAARAGLSCVVATFAGSAGPMLSQIRKYGATVLPFANKFDRWSFLAKAASDFGWFITSPYHAPVVGSHPLGIEGYKTIAYEIAEQANGAIDWCVIPVCYGDALAGIWSGFQDLKKAGEIERLPRLVAAEVHGSLSQTLANGRDRIDECQISFEALAVSIGAPRSTYQALNALRESQGVAVAVGNQGLVEMQKRLAQDEGVFAELASVTPFLAISRLCEAGTILPDDRVVAVVTASGLKDLDRSIEPYQEQVHHSTEEAWHWLADNVASGLKPPRLDT